MDFTISFNYSFLFGVDYYKTDLTFTRYNENIISIHFAFISLNIFIKTKKD